VGEGVQHHYLQMNDKVLLNIKESSKEVSTKLRKNTIASLSSIKTRK
jgi:hypothetical protein